MLNKTKRSNINDKLENLANRIKTLHLGQSKVSR